MILNSQATAHATRCLWSLQEAAPEIEGLLLTDVSGMTLTATMNGDDSMQRLGAISTTLFLLSEQMAEVWKRGEAQEVKVVIRLPKTSPYAEPALITSLKPVGYAAVLTAVYRLNRRAKLIDRDLNRVVYYLEDLLDGSDAPPPVRWASI